MNLTPSQTVGPFFSIGMTWERGRYAVDPGTEGAFWLRGTVYDGEGNPVPDAVVETWQREPDLFARSGTDPQGRYEILTVRPGPVPGPDGARQAPHLVVSVFARGLLDRVVTRVYFGDEASANDSDPILGLVDPDRRATLVAAVTPDGVTFDVRLQGEGETVFFAI